MKIAVILCASLGGLTATAVGLFALDEFASGDSSPTLPLALAWWLAVAWVPALAGLLLLFEKGGPAAALAFGSCPVGGAILALPDWKSAGISLAICGFLSLAAVLSLGSPAVLSENQAVPREKPRPLVWLGGAVLLSALLWAGLQGYFALQADARQKEAEKVVREIAGMRGVVAEVTRYKARKQRLEREVQLANDQHQSYRKLSWLHALDTVTGGEGVSIETVEVKEQRFEMTLTAPSLGAAAQVEKRLSALPAVDNTRIARRVAAPGPGLRRYVLKGDLKEEATTSRQDGDV